MTVNDAREAFDLVVATNSELDRDFKGEIKRANEAISDVRETIEGVTTAIQEARNVLEVSRGKLETVHRYFTDVVEMLASNQLPTDQAQAIVDLAEECQTLIMSPDQLVGAMEGRCGGAVSLLEEFDRTAGDVEQAATTAFDKIEELAGMISEYAS